MKLKYFLITITILFSLQNVLFAQEEESSEEEQTESSETEKPQGIVGLHDPSKGRDTSEFLTSHRANYFLIYRYPNVDYRDLVKFQFSFKYRLSLTQDAEKQRSGLFMGYTQMSIWDLFGPSNPFIETNYSPEVFLRWNIGGFINKIDTGILHQSNGLSEPLSRSWNRVYIEPTINLVHEYVQVIWNVWYIIDDEKNLKGNPNILYYMGYNELTLRFNTSTKRMAYSTFEIKGRKGDNNDPEIGFIEAGVSVPFRFLTFSPRIYYQYIAGYGETLIGYDQFSEYHRVGLSFNL